MQNHAKVEDHPKVEQQDQIRKRPTLVSVTTAKMMEVKIALVKNMENLMRNIGMMTMSRCYFSKTLNNY